MYFRFILSWNRGICCIFCVSGPSPGLTVFTCIGGEFPRCYDQSTSQHTPQLTSVSIKENVIIMFSSGLIVSKFVLSCDKKSRLKEAPYSWIKTMFPWCHFQVFSFIVNVNLWETRKQKRKNILTMFIFLFMKMESSQYGTPKNSIHYTKVMDIDVYFILLHN